MSSSGGVASLRVLHAPKDGNTPEQYEDACTHTDPADKGTLTVALTDGASSAVFARDWANLLAQAFGNGESFPAVGEAFASKVAERGREWRRCVEDRATSWHAQERLEREGSSATLLVVTWDLTARTFCAWVVGDICLFLVRENKLRYAFPLKKSALFDTHPDLLSTEPGAEIRLQHFLPPVAPYEPGDRFLLMTDALAAWFLGQWEAKRKPWTDLPTTNESLAPWLKKQRESGALKNDDVTLVDLVL